MPQTIRQDGSLFISDELTVVGTTGSVTEKVKQAGQTMVIPKNSIVLDAMIIVTRAEAGATDTTIDIELATDGDILTGTTDNGGALGKDKGTLALAKLVTADQDLDMEITYTGTATTTPKLRVVLLLGRADYDA